MNIKKHKSGVGHYIAQRVTAVALIPLTIWFLVLIINLLQVNSLVGIYAFVTSPLKISAIILFTVTFLYHGYLGLQVVIEDYIHNNLIKRILLITLLFFCVASIAVSIITLCYYCFIIRLMVMC